jgi:integrase
MSRVFRYGVATSRAERDPAADLRGALEKSGQERHHAALTDPRLIGGLLRAIDGYEGSLVTQCALRLAALLFLRPGELRKMEWSEVNFDAAELRIPAAKMKSRAIHIVPLSTQAINILKEIHPLTGHGRYVFPNVYTHGRPLSCNTLNSALRRMGFDKREMTSHGFRGMASTLLHEQGYPSEIVERQLAHADRDKVRAAYSHAQHLSARRKMMQWYSDYLDGLRSGVVRPYHPLDEHHEESMEVD